MELIFASNNPNKIEEIQLLLPPSITVLGLEAIGCREEIPETSSTIVGNAILKANYITQRYAYNCFADDTGLEVTALQGDPGVYSARYAGNHKNSNDNMDKLLAQLSDKTNRSAQFKTIICLNLNGEQHLFEGIVQGTICQQKRGTNGFGYDPVFVPLGQHKTFAEMTLSEKSTCSHRGLAVEKLVHFLAHYR